MVASELGQAESAESGPTAARNRLKVLEGVVFLNASREVEGLACQPVELGAVPREAAADAVHIAVTNGVEYLVTWNFEHIATAAMRVRIERACRQAGYELPVMFTPNELTETGHGEDTR